MMTKTVCFLMLLLVAVSATPRSTTNANIFLRTRETSTRVPIQPLEPSDFDGHVNIVETLLSEASLTKKDAAHPKNQKPEGYFPATATTSAQRHRGLQNYEDYFSDVDTESLEEGLAVGAALVLLLIIICVLCCCCSMCCGGRRGGGGCSLMDILAMFCCYELFCDDNPGCYLPMDGELC